MNQGLTRRNFLSALVLAPAVAAVASACGSESGTATTSAGTTAATVAQSTAAQSTAAQSTAVQSTVATTAGASTSSAPAAASAAGWAAGGTELITAAFPATSIFEQAATCDLDLTEAQTEGPCYFQADTTEDISGGKTGLPMQLCAQLVDTSCAPLAGYTIEVWSCDNRGIYSGDTSASADASSFAGDFCTANDAEAIASTYLRGQATTDAEGRVNFKTIFPGWYSGRTIHIHFAVSDPDGTTRVISQWCFADTLTEEICTTHENYADRGVQDTPLASGSDSVFPASGYEAFELTTQRNDDGTMLGYGVIKIDPTAIATASGGGAGGPGGAPPGGGTPPGNGA